MNELLKETLKVAGVTNSEKIDMEIISESPPDTRENKRLYDEFNGLLLETIEKRNLNGPSIHITGEMRALFDKKHRETCKALLEKQNARFDMIFCLDPKKYENTAQDVLLVNTRRYKKKPWSLHLAVLNILGNGIVNLFSIPKREKVHYTVADNRFVQLQSIHPPETEQKVVWILESEELNKKMASIAQEVKARSTYLSPIQFKELSRTISGPGVLNILFLLREKEIEVKELKEVLKGNVFFQNNIFEILEEHLKFIKKSKETYKITDSGREYLNLFAV